jgi:hypothetical protein
VELVQEIGSYAGFAAVLGLAILCGLYFSQARDVKRLRDWAGRAPERDAEARSRVAVANNMRQTPAAQAQAGQAVAAQPAAAAGNSGGAAAVTPAAKPGKAPLVAASAAGAGGAAAGSGGGMRPGVPASTRAGQRVSAQTSILAAEEPPRERWYRRVAPRYIVLMVAGVLVVGGGIAVGVIQLLGQDTKSGSGTPSSQSTSLDPGAAEKKAAESKPLRPADISVAVFNAAGVNGLASSFGDKVQAEGFTKDNVGNYRSGQRAESVVMYAKGREREAKLVRRKFEISAIEPASPEVLADAPQADVIVVIGADKAGQ